METSSQRERSTENGRTGLSWQKGNSNSDIIVVSRRVSQNVHHTKPWRRKARRPRRVQSLKLQCTQTCLVSTFPAGGVAVMTCGNATACLSSTADHVHPCMATIYQSANVLPLHHVTKQKPSQTPFHEHVTRVRSTSYTDAGSEFKRTHYGYGVKVLMKNLQEFWVQCC